jgi:uncharacterized protein YciI
MRLVYAVVLTLLLLIIIISYPLDILWIYDQQQSSSDSLFVVIYTAGENWEKIKAANEQAYFKEHSSFLSKLRSDETIVIGGRFSDKGMIIIKADDYNSAVNIINSDRAVIVKTFNSEIYPINFFYNGCIE